MANFIAKQIATASLFSDYSAPAEDISAFATLIKTLVDESPRKYISIVNGDLIEKVYDNVKMIPMDILKEVVYNFNYSVVVNYAEIPEEPVITAVVEVFEPNFGEEASLQINSYSAECFESKSSTGFDESIFEMLDSILDDMIYDAIEEYDCCEAFLDENLDIYLSIDTFIYE